MNNERSVFGKSSRRRRPALLLGSSVVIIALGFGAASLWRAHTFASRIEAAVPARPMLGDRAATIGPLLAQAEDKARTRASAIEGVAELGRIYHANDFVAEAEACWQLLRREQPGEARWPYYLADLRRMQSDYADHAELLEATLALAPDYVAARLQLANSLFKSGDLDAATRHYEGCLAAQPNNPYARLGQVRIALQRNRREEAKGLLEQLLGDSPHFSSAHNLYAELLAGAGDEAGANRHRWLGRETLRYREPEDPWLDELRAWCYDYDRLCVFGTIELQTEQLDRAVTYFERAVRLAPARPEAGELLASVYLKRGDASRARDLLEAALPRIPVEKSSGIYVLLSQAYRELKQPAEALRTAERGLARAGPHADLLAAVGHAMAELGRHDEAVKSWQAALAKNPGDAGVNFNLAKSFLALRRLDDALAALDRSLTLQPTYLPTLLLRGEIELQAGHLDLAENFLRRAFESHPEDTQARRLFAQWHLQMAANAEGKKDFANAEAHYRNGLAVENKHPELLVRFGLFYLFNNRPADAAAPLALFHELQPDSAPGCLFLGQAYAAIGEREKAREVLTKGAQLAERAGNTRIANECRALLRQL